MDADKLKEMSPDQMMDQAQHIWQMLDDMAQNNPQGYKKFIDQQMSDGKKYMQPPEPHMCVQTKVFKPEDDVLFINVFEWDRVPEPKSDEHPIPVMGSNWYKGKDDSGTYKIVNVAFNPKVTEEFGISSGLVEERKLLINLAIDFIQDQHKLTISRNYTLLGKKIRYKGALKKAISLLTQRMEKQDEQFDKQLDDLKKQFAPFEGASKETLLGELSNITASENKEDSEYVLDDPHIDDVIKQPEITITGTVGGKPSGSSLIQEVGSSSTSLPEPVYELTENVDSNTKIVRINLPGVSSVKECELDISSKDVHLVVKNKYELQLTFDNKVNEEEAQAKFIKKVSVLTLTIPNIS